MISPVLNGVMRKSFRTFTFLLSLGLGIAAPETILAQENAAGTLADLSESGYLVKFLEQEDLVLARVDSGLFGIRVEIREAAELAGRFRGKAELLRVFAIRAKESSADSPVLEQYQTYLSIAQGAQSKLQRLFSEYLRRREAALAVVRESSGLSALLQQARINTRSYFPTAEAYWTTRSALGLKASLFDPNRSHDVAAGRALASAVSEKPAKAF